MQIITSTQNETLCYAADELKKYVVAMSGGAICPTITYGGALDAGADTVLLALLDELDLVCGEQYDPFIDDIIDVKITGSSGYIAGSNPRSVLMGVYKYCASAGCRFIRPGVDGDYVPQADLLAHSYAYRKRADHIFRGQCSEGATSYEHMRDMVYWLPKVGMNMYMIEGLVPYTYMHKWYGHVWNTQLRIPGQETDYDMLARYIGMLERDVKKTGIQFHNVGHGWMFEPFGIHQDCQRKEEEGIARLTPEQKKYLALIKGERRLKGNATFYTHFCYSNPDARSLLVDYLVSYAQKKPYVDFLHVWLADAANNQCECEECRKTEPSDFYIMMLNELDEKLSALGLDTRIVFIAYVDTLRPPATQRLHNPGRFVFLNTIPVSCSDVEPYAGEVPPHIRNDWDAFPHGKDMMLRWHREWLDLCGNIPSMLYEYRFYAGMFDDLAQMQLTRETHEGMKKMASMPVGGSMSDQSARMAMPTSLPMVMMGETLFDRNVDYEAVVNDYFAGAYGAYGAKCRAYLEKMSELFCVKNLRVSVSESIDDEGVNMTVNNDRSWKDNPYVAEQLAKIPAHIDAFMPVIEENIKTSMEESRRLSWIYLRYHAEICRICADIYLCGAKGDMDAAREKFQTLRDYVSLHEMDTHRALDLFLLLRNVAGKVEIKMPKYFE